jgi:hypothetical protein
MRICKSGLNNVYRLITVLLLVSAPIISKGQGDEGCNGGDVFDTPCPLDTWVIVLVIIAGLATAIHLRRKQRSLQA